MWLMSLLLRHMVKAVKQVSAGMRAAAGMQLPSCACRSVQHTTNSSSPLFKPRNRLQAQVSSRAASSSLRLGARVRKQWRAVGAGCQHELCCQRLPASWSASATALLRNHTGDLQLPPVGPPLAAAAAARSTPPALPSSMPSGLGCCAACRGIIAGESAAAADVRSSRCRCHVFTGSTSLHRLAPSSYCWTARTSLSVNSVCRAADGSMRIPHSRKMEAPGGW